MVQKKDFLKAIQNTVLLAKKLAKILHIQYENALVFQNLSSHWGFNTEVNVWKAHFIIVKLQ